ncbi:GspE/PulE family protein [Candidatus Vampirococcus lugosii]|uniref:Type II secretion system protein E n=1 Tax=Candidatus Vampirococcus lugosii TaxID=2789015 RepID=A0ABS5QK87_9BACT|nr:GspE/PulE family protein [Candidatus Vampirococcus lugosii]MBS8121667.1 Type II secretion system protein E [Candidatus Vampirococcus lugosii]
MEINELKNALEESIIKTDTVKIFDTLLTIGVEMGASDIHIEPFENYSRIRLRLDGVLEELIQYPKNIQESLIAKFKIESGQMRPDEKRLPQDARVSTVTLTNKEIDLRANTLPTVWGEKLVMRIVDKSKKVPPLDIMGIEGTNNELLYKNISMPNGIVLTTGPTGSGKSTTLYAALDHINNVDVNITTYEDPVENKADGMNQSQVRADIGYTFAQGLRAALRQDPDIIMVGEIRDSETLETAMEAAMTGHLVFSTIHANSSAETITRIINMGAKHFMIAGTFNIVMAQRLGRTVCPSCKQKTNLKENYPEEYINAKKVLGSIDKDILKKELYKRGITNEQWKMFIEEGVGYVGTGKNNEKGGVCEKCGGSGYKGRIGIYEIMDFDDDIKNFIVQGKSAFELEKYALKKGMTNLERDGIFKVIGNKTTLEEIYRLTKHKDI